MVIDHHIELTPHEVKIKRNTRLKKILKWEFWPVWVFYIPIYFYYIWLSLKARSLTFFSATNPGIHMGGMVGAGKYGILQHLPQEYVPKTIYCEPGVSLEVVLKKLQDQKVSYPLIAKPDRGERGWKVAVVTDQKALLDYIDQANTPFLLQEYITHPIEVGVMYYRFPNDLTGVISSVVLKEFLTVVGDGKSTLRELLFGSDRAAYYLDQLLKEYADELDSILDYGEEKILVSIGNHSKGTRFIDGNHLINQALVGVFDQISKPFSGFYFGRYDLRTTSIEDLSKGRNIKIIELNGANAEPAHIYDSDMPILKAYKHLFKHWGVMNRIARSNHRQGVKYAKKMQVISELLKFRRERK